MINKGDYWQKDAVLRLYILCSICLLGLTGCVNYAGMKQHTEPLTVADLSTHQTYKVPAKKLATINWWNKFNDPQLNQLIAIALADSPSIQNAQSRVRKAQQLVEEASTSLWPSIDASGYLQRQRFSAFGLAPPPFNGKTFNIGELGLNFNYEFDFWGKNRQLLAASVSEQCATEADLAQARLILSTLVASTYFQLQNNSVQLNIAKQTLKQQQSILAIVKERAHHGIESDIPVTTALADAEAATSVVAQLTAAKKQAMHQLAVLLGKNPAETKIATRQFSYRQYQIHIPSSLPANLLAQRPDIYASRLRVEAAAHRINVAKARFFPNINLNGLFSYQSVLLNHLFESQSQNNAITGAIDLPIFDAGARRAQLGVRYAEYDMAVTDYNQTILTALHEVVDQLVTLRSLQSQLQAQQKSLKATLQKYKLTLSRYKHGIVDYVQVLESKQLLLQQQALQTDLERQHLQAIVGMLKALGGHDQA